MFKLIRICKTGLKAARDQRDTARNQIAEGRDPSILRKIQKAGSIENTFDAIAKEWLDKKCNDKSDRPTRLLGYVLPWLGQRPIADIMPRDILTCLRRVEDRGTAYSAHKSLQACGQVWRYAVATGRCDRDITQDLKGALGTANKEHFAALTEPKQVAGLLRAIDGYEGSFPAVCALKLAPLVFVRPGELRSAEWQHIDLDPREWRIPGGKMKMRLDHIVPLSKQAADILAELQPLTGRGKFVFQSERTHSGDRCMSENTLNGALKRLGYGKDVMTAHGFRAMARTILDEILGFRVDFIEHQLAHTVKDPNGRDYNRTAHLVERHRMMQAWADYLDALKAGGVIVTFKKNN
ncbi:Integrase Int [Candidatus Methylobacter favarea]|uniref:Integrase Int n=1 Tax=Candidatus Methylobacter favarea TaxID=2707345 RepID=A0A8S0WR15_9GAMM|nr:site-specific integrase [Candidatus Methylobacter favarea]CAA9891749.1 Integrase Int [Candidatus Methylobacter favarea]